MWTGGIVDPRLKIVTLSLLGACATGTSATSIEQASSARMAEAKEVNGLRAVVLLDQVLYGPDDPISVTLHLQNVSQRPLHVVKSVQDEYDVIITDAATGRRVSASSSADVQYAKPEVVLLRPNEKATIQISGAKTSGLDIPHSTWSRLAPGRYRLQVRYSNDDKTVWNIADNFWVGKIVTAPIAFTIK